MPEEELLEKVDSLDSEMTDRTTEIVNLEARVRVLEQDVQTLVFLCNYIRDFSNPPAGPIPARALQAFNVSFSELMRRYGVSYPPQSLR
jgi:hypothetical protein